MCRFGKLGGRLPIGGAGLGGCSNDVVSYLSYALVCETDAREWDWHSAAADRILRSIYEERRVTL